MKSKPCVVCNKKTKSVYGICKHCQQHAIIKLDDLEREELRDAINLMRRNKKR